MATDHNFIVKNGLEVGGVLIVNSSGQLEVATVVNDLHLQDNIKAKFGLGSDLKIYHSGSHSYVQADGTGSLYLENLTSNQDVYIRANDDGSMKTFIHVDANVGVVKFPNGTRHSDSQKANFGSSNDLQISHNGTDNVIRSTGGDIYITQDADDGDILIESDNGSGGNATYAMADGSEGSFKLYHYGNPKLATTSSGVEVTGTLNTSGAIVASGNGHTFYSGGGSSTASFGRNLNEALHIYVQDSTITLTADQDSDSNGQHDFILDRTFDGTGANNFRIRKAGSDQLIIDTNANVTFAGEIYAKDSDSTTDPTITFTGHTDSGFSISDYGNGTDQINIIRDGSAMALINQAGVLSNANVYTAATSSFRNFAGTWKATTGVTGNGFEFHNSADNVTPLKITSDGKLYLTNQNNNYIQHDTNYLKNQTSHGYIQIGPGNTSHAHILTDRSNFYFNTELRVNTGIIGSYDEDLILRRASNSADGQLTLSRGKFTGGSQSASDLLNSSLVLGGFHANSAFEEAFGHFYIPGLSPNQLAGSHRRHTVTITKNGTTYTPGSISSMFSADGTNTSFGHAAGSTDTIVITITGIAMSYGQHVGVQFGHPTFRAKDIEIEVTTDSGTNWTSVYDVTNFPYATVAHYHGGSGTATNGIRYTFTNFNNTGMRINQLFCYDYSENEIYFAERNQDQTIRGNWTFTDNYWLKFGSSGDLQLYHDGTNSLIRNYTSDLYIQNDADDGDIIIRTDDGSGGVTPYLTFDGSTTEANFHKTTKVDDNFYLGVGAGPDLYLMHDGTNSHIRNNTGNLTIQNNTDDGDIIFRSDDGSGGTVPYMTVDGGEERIVFSKWTRHIDNARILIGTGGDLYLQHTGSESQIFNSTGQLDIRSSTRILLSSSAGENMARFTNNGAVELFYDNAAKLATKSDGVDITGELQSDSLDVDGAADISGNLTVHGNLTVNGSTVTNSATNTTIEDALIELGSGNTGTNSNDLGLILERGTSGSNAFIGFDESDDQVVFALTTATGSSTGNLAFSSFLPIKTGTLNTTGGVTHNISATSEEVIVNVTNDAGHRNALTLNHEFDRDIGIHYHTSGGDYEVWMDSAGDDSLLFSPGTSGNPALELYQNKKAQFHGTAQFDSTVTFDVAGTNVEFLSDTTTREVLTFKQGGSTKWKLSLKGDEDLNLIPTTASSNLQISSSDFVDGNRNLTVASINNSGTSTLARPVLVNGAHDNSGKADFAVEVGGSYAQLSLYGDQVMAGSTDMNWNAKFYTEAAGGHLAVWDNDLTLFTQGSNTGSATARDIIFKPQISGTAVATERMRIKGDGNVGIGISSPGHLLDVGGIIRSSATNPQLRIHTSSGTGTGYLVFGDSADDDIGQVYYSHANNEMGFVVAAGTKMIVKSTGYVGVGTTSPAEKLEVQGNIRSERIIADGSGALFRKQVDAWTSGAQTHDILYNGWTNSTGDYTYVKAAGNGLSGHGILQVGDLGTWIGQTNLEQGALADSNTDPIDTVFAFFRSDKSYIKGSLGIGTNNPSFATGSGLEIEQAGIATLRFQNTSSGKSVEISQDSDFKIESMNSSSDILLMPTANVGIGTTSPGQKLDVIGSARIAGTNGTGTADYTLLVENTNTNAQAIIKFKPNADRNIGPFIKSTQRGNDAADGDIQIGDESGTIATFNAGRMGIGNTSPSSILEVADETPIITLKDTTGTAAAQNASPYIRFWDQDGATLGYFGYSSTSNNHFAIVNQQNAPVKIHTNNTERLRVLGSGDVAINRTSILSDNKLSISADSGEGAIGIQCNQLDGSTKLFDVFNSGGTNLYQQVLQNDSTPNLIWRMFDGSSTITERMRFTHDGKLGINDSAPSKAKLQINQQSNTLAAIQLTNSSQTSSNFGTYPISILFGDEQVGSSARHQASINAVREAWSDSPAALTFKTSATVNGATEKMRIASDGDVGIGTTTPAFKLDVNGNVRANGYIRVNSGGSFRLYNSAGNAWIELFFDETNNMLQVQRGFKPSTDSTYDLGTNTVRWRNVYADTYYGSGANLTGVLTGAQDLYTGSTHPSNSFIDFDDDAGVGGATNTTSLVSVGGMNFIIDSNNNGSDQFNWMHNNTAPSSAASLMTLDSSGNLDVTGQLSATTKSFDIEHPTKEGKRLHHGVLEGPEHAVYIRGRTKGSVVQLPEYWIGLVHEDTITVQLTPIGKSSELYVKDIADNKVLVSNDTEYFYFIQAERKDVERFEVEYEV